MANILDLEVTIAKYNLKDSYNPELSPFSIKRGEKVKFDDDKNELIVKLPTKTIRRVKMTKAYVETFTKYL